MIKTNKTNHLSWKDLNLVNALVKSDIMMTIKFLDANKNKMTFSESSKMRYVIVVLLEGIINLHIFEIMNEKPQIPIPPVICYTQNSIYKWGVVTCSIIHRQYYSVCSLQQKRRTRVLSHGYYYRLAALIREN